MINVFSSGEYGLETSDDEWVELLEIPATGVVDGIVIINEGNAAGFWRLVDLQTEVATPAARLPVGAGDLGERRAVVTVPHKGLSRVRLEVKRGLMGNHLSGLFAFGVQ